MIFILYEISILKLMRLDYQPSITYVLYYTLNISLFYFHALIVLKRGTINTKADYWRLPIFIALELIVHYCLAISISWILIEQKSAIQFKTVFSVKAVAGTVWRGIYFILYASAYYLLFSYNDKRRRELVQTIENEQLQNKLLRAEQDFLRAQINPHLLFNTLSFIKYAAKKKPEEANEAIMRLSSIMGFALENNSQTILVSKELEQVENIIKLNQLRFNHTLHINYVTQLNNDQVTIIPIILLTLVENIFKHGNLLDKDYPAEIRVASMDEYLTIQTSNLPNYDSNVESGKTGLANITSRLDQFYKNNYKFSHEMAGKLFKVELVLKLKN
ncbi:sensor histidine kinase [Pedobacter cryoconitis]|uniref:sensor histidine kinase n=1 Tax=Pedobacter cryoconitis TaxID=188932 RepID=UPI0018DB577F|nr:histidine kinase [Pedobacter cryoconitis]